MLVLKINLFLFRFFLRNIALVILFVIMIVKKYKININHFISNLMKITFLYYARMV